MKHILYIEDDEDLRNALARSFKFAGYDAFTCTTVEEARAALKAFQFDVVVSDWNLGAGGTGGQVYGLVAALQPDLAKRFMFLSGDQPEINVHVPWLKKPVTNKEILQVVDQLHAKPRTRRQTKVRGSAP